ncbi:MAG: transcriptional repressor LexA [Deltaproteobacteria bacterium]|jgi:repressor LexA|nr:transcriptional repressor LexA [Deltaproteobacteria bacterium]
MVGLTPAQDRVYRFVKGYIDQHGHAPSYEEIRTNLGFKSLNAVSKHLKQIEDRGYLRIPWKNRKRAMEVVSLQIGGGSVPFLGVVAAGTPIEPVEVHESIEVPDNFLGKGANFALLVKGDSMIDDGIRDGDILIVTRQPQAENGQTVVALVNGESTVKKFYRLGKEIELRPANEMMKPIRAAADEVEVVGVVMGLLRNYRQRSRS